MKVWISKYALTQGVYAIDAELCGQSSPNMIRDLNNRSGYGGYFYRPDWHETEDAAIVRAETMRDSKLISLRKQIVKLQAKKFTIKEKGIIQ